MTLSAMHFAHPELFVVGLAWLALFVGLVVFERHGTTALDRLVGPVLRDRLVDRPARWRRFVRLALVGVAGAAMSIALMQPQWGERYISTPRVGAEIMIALDVSRSMLADDAKPSRLERAKAEVRDLLSYLGDDYVGLIAFAGRASVLSPMTPDKSFLRLALDGAGPHSVSRGGTRLSEPINRAVAGFGEQGPAQRALILITDGEDHDSFAVDAARAAAEAGIKIIAIGFGDENGSPIYLRDPRSGARTQLRDGEGRPVVSRLNGDLLRELALVTDGAFVPAGTGVLDLASIYDAHIAKLTRGQLDERGRTIRDEIYQIFVLIALVCLVAAVFVSTGRLRARFGAAGSSALLAGLALGLGLALVSVSPGPAGAAGVDEAPAAGAIAMDAAFDGAVGADGADGAEAPATTVVRPGAGAELPDEDPRERFNRGVEALEAGEAVVATTLLRAARRDARDDLELRYAATYNLGLAAVARADRLAGENAASESLAALHEAADWFREAAGARPEERAPRHNLDVTLRRAMILADRLAQAEAGEIEAELDQLIEAQRERVGQAAGLLEAISRAGELDAAERLRPAFADAATEQRLLLTRADELAERIARERDAITNRPEEEREPEDALRAAQLDGALVYLDEALDRMGQTRRQLRQRRAERAYRRGSAALGDLKRARDQLRDPVQQIGVLLEEVGGLVGATNALATAGQAIDPGSGAAGAGPTAAALPAFLTPESLEEESRRIENRVRELGVRLEQAALDAQSAAAAETAAAGAAVDGASTPPGEPSPADRAALREALVEAAPRVAEAAASLEASTAEIAAQAWLGALRGEAEAGRLLAEAQEHFFDLRQLLDQTTQDQTRIAELVASEEAEIVTAREEYVPLLRELEAKNLERATRLVELLARERTRRLAELEASLAQDPSGGAGAGASATADPADPEADPLAQEAQRFDLAEALLAMADGAMQRARDGLGGEARAVTDWAAVAESAAQARDHLESLRSLFFSIIEHLEKLAQDQLDTNDATRDAVALAAAEQGVDAGGAGDAGRGRDEEPGEERDEPGDPQAPGAPVRGPETTARAAALAQEQARLEARAGGLADALLAQSETLAADPAVGATPLPPSGPNAAAGEGEDDPATRMRRAAEHVASAQLAMRDAKGGLEDEAQALASVEPPQALALEELAKALALLAPPPPPESQQQGEQQPQDSEAGEDGESQPEPQSGEDEAGSEGENPQDAPEDPAGDPSQLLQGVRDREAERRRERERDQERRRSAPVEKDW